MSSHHGTILLVEDDSDLRTALELLLRRRGYEVIATGDGIRAVELADEFKPAVALVDLLLPGQSGFRVTHALKERFGDEVRVLVMSGSMSSQHRDYAMASGAELFLPKPFGEAALLDALASVGVPQPTATETRRLVKIGA